MLNFDLTDTVAGRQIYEKGVEKGIHQANGFILEHLRKKLAIPKEKFHTYLENVGNTVSSTIPIALEQLYGNNIIKKKQKIMLVAFGVGYSWAVTVLNT